MKLLTTKEVAIILSLNLVTVQRMCKTGRIPAAKIGKSYRIEETEFANWFDENKGKKI